MHAMIKGLDMSHFVPLSLHFSGQTLDPLPDLEVTTNLYGKELFARRCQHCHSIDAMGQAGIPRLAGQQPIYIKGQLKNFRSGNEKRKHFGMAAITKDLTDEQINNLITHLSGLNQ